MSKELGRCVEPAHGKPDIRIQCPNEACGMFRDGNTYEMRSYPMCAFHALGYYANKSRPSLQGIDEQIQREKSRIKNALNNERMRRAKELMDAVANEES